MNASSHLQSLGWLGPGHALNAHLFPSSSNSAPFSHHRGRGGLGLTKPLLVSQKKDTSGLGRRGKQDEPNGGEWWLKGFENALGRVGGDGMENREKTDEGLYGGFFVRGGSLGGTIGPEEKIPRHRKRKSDALENELTGEHSSSPPHKSSRIEDSSSLQDATKDFAQASVFFEARDREKEVRRRIRREKRSQNLDRGALEEFQQIESYLGSRDVEEAERKRRKRAAMRGRESIGDTHSTVERASKEVKREGRKRRQRDESVDQDAVADGEVSSIGNPTEIVNGVNKCAVLDTEEDRKAERRRRKEERRRLRRAEKASQKSEGKFGNHS